MNSGWNKSQENAFQYDLFKVQLVVGQLPLIKFSLLFFHAYWKLLLVNVPLKVLT
jgi:hypothetical protein